MKFKIINENVILIIKENHIDGLIKVDVTLYYNKENMESDYWTINRSFRPDPELDIKVEIDWMESIIMRKLNNTND